MFISVDVHVHGGGKWLFSVNKDVVSHEIVTQLMSIKGLGRYNSKVRSKVSTGVLNLTLLLYYFTWIEILTYNNLEINNITTLDLHLILV